MSSALSLYRRHRPRNFDDVVGQEAVVKTLRNAVEQDKVHHAYLFVGSRGTGKTSMAKILAAALNCSHGPTVTPCGECESCVSIASATSLDVIEMDAASNNSVDDIRELRERVAFAPTSGRYKVYILDEAHMLTNQAWNAFLKTLEEPPPNTVFVLATTEAKKVLPTVVDRCHRFDFKRPSTKQLAEVIERVAASEGITIGPDVVALTARSATGSFRDALGTLEQLVAYEGMSITMPGALAVIGAVDRELLEQTLTALYNHDAAGLLRVVAELADSGRDFGQFSRDLEAYARDLLIVATLGEVPTELAVSTEADAALAQLALPQYRGELVRLLDLLAFAQGAVRTGADARTQLELALIKAAEPGFDPTVRALMARLERLEQSLQLGAGAEPSLPVNPPPPVKTPVAFTPPPVVDTPAVPQQDPVGDPGPQEPAAEFESPASEPTDHLPDKAAVQPAVEETPTPAVSSNPPQAGSELELAREHWAAVLSALKADSPMLAAALSSTQPTEFEDGELKVAFPAELEFHMRRADQRENRLVLAEKIRSVVGIEGVVSFALDDSIKEAELPTESSTELTEDQIIERFKNHFGAEEIQPQQSSS